MIRVDGHEAFVIDGHVHFWDGSPENWRNQWGEGWIKCFYDYHTALTPKEWQWSFDEFCKYPAEKMVRDLFLEGHVDMAIFNSTYLKEFFTNGFNTHEQN
ncbi:MAG: amidohydrolase, partial [Thermorudis peleae]|nr:amidohydrolase [Thermorudis peleae]